MTIYGLGGCGKSALALEFAYCALATHVRRVVFWVPAISQESFELAFRDIGVRLRIPGVGDDNANVKQLVREALSSENLRDWLMIVDNADDPKVLLEVDSKNPKSVRLIDYIPHSNEGLVLFTTRSRKLATELTQTHVLPLDDMGEAEARQLLICRTANKALLNEEATVNKLLETLTGLPLAIVQAAAFINQNDISCSEYLSLFQHADTKAELFRERFEQPDRYQGIDSAIAQTWHISFEQIQRQDPLAAEYLSFIACIDRISIPQSLLPPGDSLVQRTKALGTLTGYAFLTERQCTVQGSNKDRLFDMHRLVHMALIWWLEGHDRRKTWTAIAAARVEELVPYGGHERREVWTAYLPHAIHVAGPKVAIDSAKRAPLLERIGRCQESIGQYSAAEMAHREAWSLLKDTLGPEHPNTLTSMGNLAWVLDRQGRYEEAKSMNRQTLARRENVLGPEHPDTLTSMSNLASVLDKQGKYEEAESINRQTLARREKVVGPEDLDTLTSMSNLASVLSRQGKYEEAESIHRQTLARYKMVVGPEHPDTLTSTINLALVLSKQGKYNEAEMMNRQTLARDKKVLGPEHPDTLTTMGNLASVLDKQGKYEEAESINRETLARREKVLGPEHPGTLTSMNNLALVLYSQGKYEEAESINRETLGRIEKLVGPEHPDTLMSMNNLALVLDRQGKYEEAASINRETLGRMEKALGPEHPGTLTSISNLALVLDRQGKYKEAEMMNRQTLARREKVVGPEHPDTLTSMGNLASVLGSQGKYEEAESINRETLARMEKVLGPEHPETLASVYCLAHLLAKQRRISESSLLYQRAVAGYSVVLGVSHPTTQACCRHHSDLCALEEQHRLTSLDSDVGTSTRKDSRLSRGLAKLGIHRSKVA
jgi:tetratricopeptide (TPR) repeat protein